MQDIIQESGWFKLIERQLCLIEERRNYFHLCKRLERHKQFLFCLGPKEFSAISELQKKRKELVRFFSQPHIKEVCRSCGGNCCCISQTSFSGADLLYFAALSFKFPKPDWKFIASRLKAGRAACVFLTNEGCSLGENRPRICLSSVCDSLLEVFKRENLGSELEVFKRENLGSKFGVKNQGLSDAIGRYYRVLKDSAQLKAQKFLNFDF